MVHEKFEEYLVKAVGTETAAKVSAALGREASVSIRFHPFKTAGLPTAFSAEVAPGVPALLSGRVAWSPCGFFLDRRPQFTPDPSWHGGQYYVQDSSAMFVGHVFRQVLREYATLGRPVRVLDLCAAPGGKTTDLAASLRTAFGDRFLLVANEIVRRRAVLLAENAALWGDPNVCVTSCAPAVFSRLPGFFDIVLADVPCSGEGMFRKEAEARSQWSPEKVARCRALQRKIVADIWPALADGGRFLYSTCTFNGMENDGNAAWICENLGAETMQINDLGEGPLPTACGVLLAPGLVRGEGQYCSLLRKDVSSGMAGRPSGNVKGITSGSGSEWERRVGEMLSGAYHLTTRNGTVVALPEVLLPEMELLESLHPLSAGIAVGLLKGGTFVPHADLALSIKLRKEAFHVVELDRRAASAFLHGDCLEPGTGRKGLWLLCFHGLPLGFARNVGNRCNSLLPAARRIRKDYSGFATEE